MILVITCEVFLECSSNTFKSYWVITLCPLMWWRKRKTRFLAFVKHEKWRCESSGRDRSRHQVQDQIPGNFLAICLRGFHQVVRFIFTRLLVLSFVYPHYCGDSLYPLFGYSGSSCGFFCPSRLEGFSHVKFLCPILLSIPLLLFRCCFRILVGWFASATPSKVVSEPRFDGGINECYDQVVSYQLLDLEA